MSSRSSTCRRFVNDYGTEAVDTLLKLMEDNRGNLIVITAGYHEKMQEFVKHPGLKSRFNKFLQFQDYAPEELNDISPEW